MRAAFQALKRDNPALTFDLLLCLWHFVRRVRAAARKGKLSSALIDELSSLIWKAARAPASHEGFHFVLATIERMMVIAGCSAADISSMKQRLHGAFASQPRHCHIVTVILIAKRHLPLFSNMRCLNSCRIKARGPTQYTACDGIE